jgi:hypothetical protein
MPYTKTQRAAEAALALGTTGGAVADIANHGVTYITGSTVETYTLAAPVAGCRKTIVFNSSTTTLKPIIKLSTVGTGATFMANVTQSTGLNVMEFTSDRSTAHASVVELVGVNTTSWLITNIWPICTAPSASLVGGKVITLSSA